MLFRSFRGSIFLAVMKPIFLFVAILLLVGAVFLEHSESGWPLDRPLIRILAKITHHALPSVTAVKMPIVESKLVPQDVALAFRAIISFHPSQIVVLESATDFLKGPFSILREAVEKEKVDGVTIHFIENKIFSQQKYPFSAVDKGEARPSSERSRGSKEGHCFKEELASEVSGCQQKSNLAANIQFISLEDLLLRREERERGSILLELDTLFSGQPVLLGGATVKEAAAVFLNQAEKKWMMVPSLGVELPLLLLLVLVVLNLRWLSWIDFLLILLGLLGCYLIIDAWMLKNCNILFSSMIPCSLLLIAFFGKVLSCTVKMKR